MHCYEMPNKPNIEALSKLLAAIPAVRNAVVQQGKIKLKTNFYTREEIIDEAVRGMLMTLNPFTY
jgi:hypothetical protein